MIKKIENTFTGLEEIIEKGQSSIYVSDTLNAISTVVNACNSKISNGSSYIVTDFTIRGIDSINPDNIKEGDTLKEYDIDSIFYLVFRDIYSNIKTKDEYRKLFLDYGFKGDPEFIIEINTDNNTDKYNILRVRSYAKLNCTIKTIFNIELEIYNKEDKDKEFDKELERLNLSEGEIAFYKNKYSECIKYNTKNVEYINRCIGEVIEEELKELFISKEYDIVNSGESLDRIILYKDITNLFMGIDEIRPIMNLISINLSDNKISVQYLNKEVFSAYKEVEYKLYIS